MKKLLSLALTAILTFAAGVHAQTAFPLFQPSDGIMVGDQDTFVTTSAVGTDVTALFSGTCNGAAFLRGDASCFALFAGTNAWTAANTYSLARTNASPPVLLSANTTALRFNETDGTVNNRQWEWALNGDQFRLALLDDTGTLTGTALLVDRTLGTVDSIALTSTALTWNGNPISTAVGANPTASLGLTAINGAATTFMRSDAAPALNVTIAPTWTGTHLFQGSAPRIRYNATGAAVDEKQWATQIFSTGTFSLNTRTDVDGTGADAIVISRIGTAINTTAFNAATFQVNASTATNFSNAGSTNTFAGPVVINNTVSGATNYQASSGTPAYFYNETDAGLDEKNWMTRASGGGTFILGTATDAAPTSLASTALQIERTGTNVDSVSALTDFRVAGSRSEIENAVPMLQFDETDAGANERNWLAFTSAGAWRLSTATDASPQTAVATAITVDRTGTAVDSVTANSHLFVPVDLVNAASSIVVNAPTLPAIELREVDAAANNERWRTIANGEQYLLQTLTDDGTVSGTALTVDRTGTAIDSVALSGTTIAVNGTLDVNGSADIGDNTNAVLLRNNTSGIGVRGTNTGATNISALVFQDSAAASVGVIGDASSGNSTFSVLSSTSGATMSISTTGAGPIQLVTNGSERLLIDSDGSFDYSGTGGTSGQVLTSNGAGASPTWQTAAVSSSSGTFSGTFTAACTTSPAGNFRYAQVGNMVTIMLDSAVSCTSDTALTAVDAASIPVAIRPPANRCVNPVMGTDNTTVNGPVAVRVGSDGSMNFAFNVSNCSGTNWTAAGTKTVGAFSISYVTN